MPVVARRLPRRSLIRVDTWAIGGATIGVALVWLGGAADPVVGILCVAASAALVADGAGRRTSSGTLTARLLLAAVYVTIGVRHPSILGIVVAIFGAALAVLAYAGSRSRSPARPVRRADDT
ncbi:MAG TPA: hypothetical protein VH834_24490 [Solirubrobacteraceae bacterium]|jgi:hypothetical protein